MSDDSMLKAHRATYAGFVRLIIYSTAIVVIALILMAIFLL